MLKKSRFLPYYLWLGWLGANSVGMAQVASPAPPPPPVYLLEGKSRELTLAAKIDAKGTITQVTTEDSSGVPRIDREAAQFIQSHCMRRP
jgi:hypothetical protein